MHIARELTNSQGLMAATSWLPWAFSLGLCRLSEVPFYISGTFCLVGLLAFTLVYKGISAI